MTTADTEAPGLDGDALAQLIKIQDGVVGRRQIIELGGQEWDVRRMLRRGELHLVHPGVMVNHNGELTAAQRRWAAVHAHWPAALAMETALGDQKRDDVIHVAIAHGRTVQPMAGVLVHRLVRFDERVKWNASPPTMRIEDATVCVALAQADVLGTFETLAKSFRSRRTTVARLRREVSGRARVPRRRQIMALLDDLESGACSVLEREWLAVEARHELPTASRQHVDRDGVGTAYVDARYLAQGVRVELDGREFHDEDSSSWDSDHERDLDAAAESDELTIRLTYAQVFRLGCRTAARVARILQRRGWDGELQRCPACPTRPSARQ